MSRRCRCLSRREFLQRVGSIALFVGSVFAGCTAAGGERQSPPQPSHLSETESAGTPPTVPSAPSAVPGDVPVRFADTGVGANAPIYVALKRGYFREEGLDIHLVPSDTADRMIPALATDQVDAAGAGIGAGLFNAIARGIPIKVVAGQVVDEPGHYGAGLLLRKEIVAAGRVHDYADLRGLRVGLPSLSSSLGANFARLLALGNLTAQDVEVTEIPPPELAVAMTNGAIDAALIQEPFSSHLVQAGAGVRWRSVGDINPHHQATVLLYGPGFPERAPDAATRFLVAYLRGVRDYSAAMQGGGDPLPIYEILAEYTAVKDLNLYGTLAPNVYAPDGRPNRASLEADQELWVAQGRISQRANLAAAVDTQYLDRALRLLGESRR
jgi:NitT/TauT family transport system substrate-binding protein